MQFYGNDLKILEDFLRFFEISWIFLQYFGNNLEILQDSSRFFEIL